jgi:hypothetical protein
MVDQAKAAETTPQLLNLGIITLACSTLCSSDIRKWHKKPDADKTWPFFKKHFKACQKAIKPSQPAITTDALGHHKANTASIVDQSIDRLTAPGENNAASTANSTLDFIAEQQAQQQIALSTQQNQTMIETMQALATTLSTLQNQDNTGSRNDTCSRREQGRDRGHNTDSAGQGGQGSTVGCRSAQCGPPGCCWTHGNCSHTGAQ